MVIIRNKVSFEDIDKLIKEVGSQESYRDSTRKESSEVYVYLFPSTRDLTTKEERAIAKLIIEEEY